MKIHFRSHHNLIIALLFCVAGTLAFRAQPAELAGQRGDARQSTWPGFGGWRLAARERAK